MKAASAPRRPPRTARAQRDVTWPEFAHNLEDIFPGAGITVLGEKETTAEWLSHKPDMRKLIRESSLDNIVLFIKDPNSSIPARAVRLIFPQNYNANDVKLAHCFARVFGNDLRMAAAQDSPELWVSLQQTRFSRIIGRFSTFSTEAFVSWLRTMENAASLTLLEHGPIFHPRDRTFVGGPAGRSNFEITEQTRAAIRDWLIHPAGRDGYLFPSRLRGQIYDMIMITYCNILRYVLKQGD